MMEIPSFLKNLFMTKLSVVPDDDICHGDAGLQESDLIPEKKNVEEPPVYVNAEVDTTSEENCSLD